MIVFSMPQENLTLKRILEDHQTEVYKESTSYFFDDEDDDEDFDIGEDDD